MDERPYGSKAYPHACDTYPQSTKPSLSTVLYMDFPASSFYNYCYRHSLVHQIDSFVVWIFSRRSSFLTLIVSSQYNKWRLLKCMVIVYNELWVS